MTRATPARPNLTVSRAARELIAEHGSEALAEAQERLLLMHAIGSQQGILSWLAIVDELSAWHARRRSTPISPKSRKDRHRKA